MFCCDFFHFQMCSSLDSTSTIPAQNAYNCLYNSAPHQSKHNQALHSTAFHAKRILPSSALWSSSTCAVLCLCFLRASVASIQSKHTSGSIQFYDLCQTTSNCTSNKLNLPFERSFLIANCCKSAPLRAFNTGRRKLLI